jgi:hypothetical protein
MTYDFLLLCLIMALPAVPLLVLRRDLWPAQRFGMLVALPFAFAEPLFYPSYWQPAFLFNLGARLGFGIEDFLFVSILAILGTSLWPWLGRFRLKESSAEKQSFSCSKPQRWKQSCMPLLKALLYAGLLPGAVVIGFMMLNIHALYASYAAMLAFTILVCIRRPDLTRHAAGGALAMLITYWAACLLLGIIYDGIFQRVWHSSGFIGIFILSVPIEECIYALLAGAAAAVIYPFVTQRYYEKMPRRGDQI